MNQIIIDGKIYNLIPVEEEEKSTGWERGLGGKRYYHIDPSGVCRNDIDEKWPYDVDLYNYGNYFSDEQLAKDVSRAISLWLRLNRFAAEHQALQLNWENDFQSKYTISYSHYGSHHDLFIDTDYGVQNCFIPYFTSKEVAEKAIAEFGEDLIWYFTEFKNTRKF